MAQSWRGAGFSMPRICYQCRRHHRDRDGPDFGGDHDDAAIFEHLDRIHDTLLEIFERADTERAATNFVADQMAEERFRAAA